MFLGKTTTARTIVTDLRTSQFYLFILNPGLAASLWTPSTHPLGNQKKKEGKLHYHSPHSTAYQWNLSILEASHQFNYLSAKWSFLQLRSLYFAHFYWRNILNFESSCCTLYVAFCTFSSCSYNIIRNIKIS